MFTSSDITNATVKHPCGPRCRCLNIKDILDTTVSSTFLFRTTHQICTGYDIYDIEGNIVEVIPCDRCVSDYKHLKCYICARPGTEEFIYHHQKCDKSGDKSKKQR